MRFLQRHDQRGGDSQGADPSHQHHDDHQQLTARRQIRRHVEGQTHRIKSADYFEHVVQKIRRAWFRRAGGAEQKNPQRRQPEGQYEQSHRPANNFIGHSAPENVRIAATA